jgi:phosphotransferase system IIB component
MHGPQNIKTASACFIRLIVVMDTECVFCELLTVLHTVFR